VAGLLWPELLAMLKERDWSGNVRELANVMECAFTLAGGGPITPGHLQLVGRSDTASLAASVVPEGDRARTLEEIEMAHRLRMPGKHRGRKTAAELGISLETIYNKPNRVEKDRKAAGRCRDVRRRPFLLPT
jgi:DNA-binding NtrC family response regulator